ACVEPRGDRRAGADIRPEAEAGTWASGWDVHGDQGPGWPGNGGRPTCGRHPLSPRRVQRRGRRAGGCPLPFGPARVTVARAPVASTQLSRGVPTCLSRLRTNRPAAPALTPSRAASRLT